MHRTTNYHPYIRTLRSIAGTVMHTIVTVTVAAQAAMGDVLRELARRFLIHLAAGPYPAGELYDPSTEYETAREILAMERLVTGTFGSLLGAGRVLRLFGGIEPLVGLVHCTIAMRTTEGGDDLFLSFELDPLMLNDHDEPTEFTVQLIRTPKDDGWQGAQRAEFADATAALIEFYSERPLRMRLD